MCNFLLTHLFNIFTKSRISGSISNISNKRMLHCYSLYFSLLHSLHLACTYILQEIRLSYTLAVSGASIWSVVLWKSPLFYCLGQEIHLRAGHEFVGFSRGDDGHQFPHMIYTSKQFHKGLTKKNKQLLLGWGSFYPLTSPQNLRNSVIEHH